MNILITGANGFIGMALCDKLLADGYQVRGAVRGQEKTEVRGQKSEIRGQRSEVRDQRSEVEGVMVGDISPETDWSEALDGINGIVHLAARVHVMRDGVADPLAAYREVNVEGTKCLAIAAANAGVKRFVFISSIKVNGEGRSNPYTEMDKPEPHDPYAVSKWEAEQVLRDVEADTGLEVVILRPPLVYGPGVKANFLRLFKIVERGIPLPFAKIDNRRSFIYLDNMIDAIITCINHPGAAEQTFLISDVEDVSTSELIRRIALALEKQARLFSIPPFLMRFAGKLLGKSAAIDRLLGSLMIDSSKIRRELGWKPPYTMKHGLKETAKWYTKKLAS